VILEEKNVLLAYFGLDEIFAITNLEYNKIVIKEHLASLQELGLKQEMLDDEGFLKIIVFRKGIRQLENFILQFHEMLDSLLKVIETTVDFDMNDTFSQGEFHLIEEFFEKRNLQYFIK
jgi:hypothetical protein